MTTGIGELINSNYQQLPNDSSGKKSVKQIPIEEVDKLADEIATTYKNTKYRSWYCGVIYEFGLSQVHEWRRRAEDGNYPAKLFSKYVKDARQHKARRINPNG